MKIAIVGCGHMGAFVAEKLSAGHEIFGFDVNPGRVESVPGITPLQTLDAITDIQPDMVINAVPLRDTVPVFEAMLPHLSQTCMLADLASVKGPIPDFYAGCGRPFVSVHPMFGPTFARMDALTGECGVIITESDPTGAAVFEELFESLGVSIFRYSFDEHDRMMAYSLTMPFVSTMVFAACLDEKTVPGTTFRRHREIAEGLLSEDDGLLAEILFNPHSMAQIERVTSRMEFMKHVIRGRDTEEATRFFNSLRANLAGNGTGGDST